MTNITKLMDGLEDCLNKSKLSISEGQRMIIAGYVGYLFVTLRHKITELEVEKEELKSNYYRLLEFESSDTLVDLMDTNTQQAETIERLKETLKFYATKSHLGLDGAENGKLARQALLAELKANNHTRK